MKTLENDQLEIIQGGRFWDGFCAGASLALTVAPIVCAVPGLNIAAGVVAGGCAAYLIFG